jgi:mannose-6-phosphate isomerase-like protein (cupin superfamily)
VQSHSATFRRVVTGHDADGKAVISDDSVPPYSHLIGGPGGPTFIEVWNTRETPVVIEQDFIEPTERALMLGPPKGGTRLRIIDFPPESAAIRQLTADGASAAFAQMGDAAAAGTHSGAPHPLMHRTQTVDYGIVLEGELTMIMDRGETTVRAGDIVVQRGTNHAWSNRSGANCRVAFVLIDGQFSNELKS